MSAKAKPSGSNRRPTKSVDEIAASLATRIAKLAPTGEGFLPSPLPGARLMRSVLHVPRVPVTYVPGIVIIAQGRKWGHVGSRTFVYDSHHYLVLAVPLPFECETLGSAEEPLLGVAVNVSPAVVAELVLQMEQPAPPADARERPRAIEATLTDEALLTTAVRLLDALGSPDDARILGPQIVREIIYRVLRGKAGGTLRALAAPHSHFGQISRVLNRFHTDYARPHDMEALARDAGMSVSAFHAHFKAVTASSPLQYLKTTRLHKARLLLVYESASAAQAAVAVGYESASQFSREFKRLFGASPAAEAARLRASRVRLD